MKMVPALAALAMMLCGCVSFEYDGVREAEPSASVKMFTDKAKIKQSYQVMGKAVVSGDYMDVSRDRLEEKLLSEAESVGADAVLITSQEVVRSSSGKNTNPLYMSAFDYDDSSPSWRAIYRDVDLTYGNVRGTPSDTGPLFRYRRVLKAEFLKYRPDTTPAETAKEAKTEEKAASGKAPEPEKPAAAETGSGEKK